MYLERALAWDPCRLSSIYSDLRKASLQQPQTSFGSGLTENRCILQIHSLLEHKVENWVNLVLLGRGEESFLARGLVGIETLVSADQ